MEHLEKIQSRIYEVRGVRVMLDFDLAELYQVETRVLKQAVRRNLERFPEDFMFEMTEQEYNSLIISLRSQFVISNERGGRRYMPYAFTEHGVIMLASLLRSEIAVQMSVQITRAFVAMRNYIMSTRHIEAELAELRAKLELLERNDEENLAAVNDLSEDMRGEIADIYQAIAALSVKVHQSVADQPRQKIGFKTGKDEKK
jgi:hypothetical protein